jgi:hypothetical protein
VGAAPRISRVPDGVRLDLPDDEREVLRQIAGELRALLEEAPDEPGLRRLFPRAHEDDTYEQQYRDLTHEQLASGRDRALSTIEETAANTLLSPEEADAWLRGLNDARLVLGTRLDVTEGFDWEAVDVTHPRAQELALYAYLSWLQEQLVEAIA